MATNNSSSPFDVVSIEDVTHLFMGDNPRQDTSGLAHFIAKMEQKEKKSINRRDFNQMFDRLKLTCAANKSLSNQVKAIKKELEIMRSLNREQNLLLDGLKAAGCTNSTASERIQNVHAAFRTDEFVKLFSFTLNDEVVDVTRNQMKEIVTWYEKGFVYFQRFDQFRVDTEKVHLYTFGEIVQYINRANENNKTECFVCGEDPNTVDVLFLDDFDRSREGVNTPTHVLKSRIRKCFVSDNLDSGDDNVRIALSKRTLMTFLLNIGHTNPFYDETQY